MLKMFEGFKNFVLRGNAIELAVGVVIGAAFNGFINSLVKGFLTPLIGAVAKTPDFSSLTFTINGSKFMYGDVINNAISFLLSAIAIYYFVIVPMNLMTSKMKKKEEQKPTTKKCSECLSDIPIEAKRCSHCAQMQ